MNYRLVLSEAPEEKTKGVGKKDIGENVFFDNLPADYKVYLFYYPRTMPNVDLENKLRSFGSITGNNLFVNIGRLGDSAYPKIASKFGIKGLPVIIMTGIDKLASPPTEFSTGYVKMDDKNLLSSPGLTIECVEKVFNLFIQGKISQAMREQKGDALKIFIKGIIYDTLKGIRNFVDDYNISFSFIEGKLELKHKGG